MGFWKGCSTCGPYFFHRWWCPELRRTLNVVSVALTVFAIVLLAAGRGVRWALAIPLLAFFWLATLAIHLGQRRRAARRGS